MSKTNSNKFIIHFSTLTTYAWLYASRMGPKACAHLITHCLIFIKESVCRKWHEIIFAGTYIILPFSLRKVAILDQKLKRICI